MIIERKWAMPNKNTFKIKPIKDLIKDELVEGVILDPFANECSINEIMTIKQKYITNDLDPNFNNTYNLEALDFLKLFDDESIDMVLFDPPYSGRQVSEHYQKLNRTVTMNDTNGGYWGRFKTEIARVVKPNGKVITFGWNSGGIGKKKGFEIVRILLVPHGGWHNDTICTVEVKVGRINGNT